MTRSGEIIFKFHQARIKYYQQMIYNVRVVKFVNFLHIFEDYCIKNYNDFVKSIYLTNSKVCIEGEKDPIFVLKRILFN